MGGVAVAVATLLVTTPWAAVLPLAFLPLVYRMNQALDEQAKSREQLAKLLALQRRFLTDVSHQVGNPLASVRTNLALIPLERLPGAAVRAVRDAAEEVTRLSELWARLRVLAETDEDVPLQVQSVDLVEIADEVVRAYAWDARRRGVRVESEASGPVPTEVDRELIRQAAANIVENAIRHSPKGRAVRLTVARRGRTSVLEVADEGPGIEASRLPEIFERFAHGQTGGSGLGLAIARNVVERHGGRILVESQPGTGSRFTIALPIKPVRQP
jgi:signal transduction histidine kinase